MSSSGQVEIEGRQYRSVKEGRATILAPYSEKSKSEGKRPRNNDEGDQAVFYNPIQQFNRDLSVLAILIYGEGHLQEAKERLERKKERWKRKKAEKGKKRPVASNDAAVDAAKVGVHGEDGGLRPNKRKAGEMADGEASDATSKKARTLEAVGDLDEEGMEIVQLDGPHANSETTNGVAPVGEQPLLPDTNSNETTKPIPFSILDALSATGLRALRYAKEIPFATKIIANDFSQEAVKSIELNIKHNEVDDKVFPNLGDARAYMYSKVGNEQDHKPNSYVHRFDVIDLDPYGTAAPFLDAAVQALADGGLLCVTCTDGGVFASNGYPEKAYALYGGIPLKGAHSHEGGLRLILHAVATSAAKYGIAIEPLLSLSIDFYARLFIRLHKQQKDVKLLAGTTMTVYNCDYGCGAWTTQLLARNQPQLDKAGGIYYKHSYAQAPVATSLCEHCGCKTHLSGPMWAGPLHNPAFIQRIIDRLDSLDPAVYGTIDRLRGMLTLALEEDTSLPTLASPTTSTEDTTSPSIPRHPPSLLDTTPFFVLPSSLAKTLHTQTPSEPSLRGALLHLGYRVTRSHCKPGSIKTNAPWSVLWEVMREWVRQKSPVGDGRMKKGAPGEGILRETRGGEGEKVERVKEEVSRVVTEVGSLEGLRAVLEGMVRRIDEEANKVVEMEAEDKSAGVNGDAVEDNVAATEKVDLEASRDRAANGESTAAPSTTTPALGFSEAKGLSKVKIVFDEQLGREKNRGKLVRYQMNPRANWGPMNRAGRG